MSAADGTVLGSSKLVNHGKDTHRMNLVFLSEGYRASEIPVFTAAVNQVVKEIRLTAPFQARWPNINVHQINISSVDKGADVPATGLKVRTFFDATYGTGCSDRMIDLDDLAVLRICNQFISGNKAPVVIVNSSRHGGQSGKVITLASGVRGALSWGVMHELGHLIGGLADEYDGAADCPGSVPQAQYSGPEPTEANITTVRDRTTLKWADLVDAATPVPTLEVPAGQCRTRLRR